MKYLWLFLITFNLQAATLTIGTKNFTEGYILAEIIAQIAERVGEAKVVRRFGMGGTGITYQALEKGEIDLYPEYTGTISEAILKQASLKDWDEISAALESDDFIISKSLGFNNTYALAMKREQMLDLKIKNLSQLSKHPNLAAAFSHEFMQRKDGLQSLKAHYGLKLSNVKGMEHSLAYQALSEGKVDIVEVYSTDAKIEKFKLNLLQDDLNFFPAYLAVILSRRSVAQEFPQTWRELERLLVGKISNEKMIRLNSMVELEGKSFADAAVYFLDGEIQESALVSWDFNRLYLRTKEHLWLVGVSLLFAILIGIPLGVLAAQNKLLGQLLLGLNGIIQTIPSLALLCLLIPIFGIGPKPAMIALLLYALLPIVRGVHSGIMSVDIKLRESALLMGLNKFQRLKYVLLPLATPAIMAGIKTSAIINVGTATLAAFIGAGGLGQIIVTGLALNDQSLILQGAIPAGILALFVHVVFELLDKIIIPSPLRRN